MKTTSSCSSCGGSIPESIIGDALCVACRYHDAPPKTKAIEQHSDRGYDLATKTASSVQSEEVRADRQDRLLAFLDWLSRGGSVTRAGERSLLLAHICGLNVFKTDADLASKLNMSRGRISQLRKQIAVFLPGVVGNSRQKIKSRGRVRR